VLFRTRRPGLQSRIAGFPPAAPHRLLRHITETRCWHACWKIV